MMRAVLALPVFLLACGSGAAPTDAPPLGSGTGGSGDGGSSSLPAYDAGSGSAPATGDDGSQPGTTPDGGCRSTDEPDDQGADTNCDGADGVVGRDVYVSADQGSDTNAGTAMAPLRTIAAGLTLATTTKGHVLVQAATYPVDHVSASGTWSIYGGYGIGFNAAPHRETTILTAPDTGLLIDTAQSALLAHLTIQGGQPSDAKQVSAYALRTAVDSLALDDVVVQTADGLSLLPAQPGAAGAAGIVGGPLQCDGVQQLAYASGATNGPSSEGKPAGNVSTKTPPLPAGDGAPGTDGVDATGKPSLAGGLVVADVGLPGQSNGHPGYGAASGGGGTDSQGYLFWAGPGGSGGCPGHGGEGGASGGSAIGIVILQGNVSVTRSRLVVGLGGDGADGGQAGAGGAGAWGGSPRATNNTPLFTSSCKQPSDDPMGFNCAGFGGRGGAGGVGGHGGGGAGGWTIGVVTVGNATGTLDAATQVSLGSPGNGGQGNGGGHAPNGRRVQVTQLD